MAFPDASPSIYFHYPRIGCIKRLFFLRVCGGWAERETDTRRVAGAHQEEPGGTRRDQEAVRRYQENIRRDEEVPGKNQEGIRRCQVSTRRDVVEVIITRV